MKKYILIFLFIYPGLSHGCSLMCDSIEELYSKSDYVFLGYTTKVQETGFNWFKKEGYEPNVDVYFDIKQNWKGGWGNKPLKTVQNKWSCYGGGFQEQRSYIMFLKKGARLTLCGQKQYSEELVKKLDSISSNNNSPSNKAPQPTLKSGAAGCNVECPLLSVVTGVLRETE